MRINQSVLNSAWRIVHNNVGYFLYYAFRWALIYKAVNTWKSFLRVIARNVWEFLWNFRDWIPPDKVSLLFSSTRDVIIHLVSNLILPKMMQKPECLKDCSKRGMKKRQHFQRGYPHFKHQALVDVFKRRSLSLLYKTYKLYYLGWVLFVLLLQKEGNQSTQIHK